jgi:hypothetical protein
MSDGAEVTNRTAQKEPNLSLTRDSSPVEREHYLSEVKSDEENRAKAQEIGPDFGFLYSEYVRLVSDTPLDAASRGYPERLCHALKMGANQFKAAHTSGSDVKMAFKTKRKERERIRARNGPSDLETDVESSGAFPLVSGVGKMQGPVEDYHLMAEKHPEIFYEKMLNAGINDVKGLKAAGFGEFARQYYYGKVLYIESRPDFVGLPHMMFAENSGFDFRGFATAALGELIQRRSWEFATRTDYDCHLKRLKDKFGFIAPKTCTGSTEHAAKVYKQAKAYAQRIAMKYCPEVIETVKHDEGAAAFVR